MSRASLMKRLPEGGDVGGPYTSRNSRMPRTGTTGLTPRPPHKTTFSTFLSTSLKRGKIQGKKDKAGKGKRPLPGCRFLLSGSRFLAPQFWTTCLAENKENPCVVGCWRDVAGPRVGSGRGRTSEGQTGHKFCLGLGEGCHGSSQVKCLRLPRSTWQVFSVL